MICRRSGFLVILLPGGGGISFDYTSVFFKLNEEGVNQGYVNEG